MYRVLSVLDRVGAMAAPSLRRFFTTGPGPSPPKDPAFWNGLKVEEKRKYYQCHDGYHTIADMVPWTLHQKVYRLQAPKPAKEKFTCNPTLNNKISLFQGDITRLEIDSIVNAANNSLLGGGGVDGAIHRAAGRSLRNECEKLCGCATGDAKVTSGHKLPARRIIHTVGPVGTHPQKLASCYQRCLEEMVKHELRSIAFPCISTGVYGYPNDRAAHVALTTVRQFLDIDDNASKVDRIIFCVFLAKDLEIYQKLLPAYFPIGSANPGTKQSDHEEADEAADPGVQGAKDREQKDAAEDNMNPELHKRSISEEQEMIDDKQLPAECEMGSDEALSVKKETEADEAADPGVQGAKDREQKVAAEDNMNPELHERSISEEQEMIDDKQLPAECEMGSDEALSVEKETAGGVKKPDDEKAVSIDESEEDLRSSTTDAQLNDTAQAPVNPEPDAAQLEEEFALADKLAEEVTKSAADGEVSVTSSAGNDQQPDAGASSVADIEDSDPSPSKSATNDQTASETGSESSVLSQACPQPMDTAEDITAETRDVGRVPPLKKIFTAPASSQSIGKYAEGDV